MLLTISTTHRPATDLGFFLYKNPARVQSFDLTFGRGHVFYPRAGGERCTAARLWVGVPGAAGDTRSWIGQDEGEKPLRHGGGWLAIHPEREQTVDRYLKRQRRLTREALARLLEEDQQAADEQAEASAHEEEAVEEK